MVKKIRHAGPEPGVVRHDLDGAGGGKAHRRKHALPFTLNFSRPASPVIAQYYNFLRLGREALPLVPFTVRADAGFTVFQLSDKLREFGWFLPAYTMPKNACDVAVMRIVVRENLSRDLAESLLVDLGRAIAALRVGEAVRHHGKPGHKSKRPC